MGTYMGVGAHDTPAGVPDGAAANGIDDGIIHALFELCNDVDGVVADDNVDGAELLLALLFPFCVLFGAGPAPVAQAKTGGEAKGHGLGANRDLCRDRHAQTAQKLDSQETGAVVGLEDEDATRGALAIGAKLERGVWDGADGAVGRDGAEGKKGTLCCCEAVCWTGNGADSALVDEDKLCEGATLANVGQTNDPLAARDICDLETAVDDTADKAATGDKAEAALGEAFAEDNGVEGVEGNGVDLNKDVRAGDLGRGKGRRHAECAVNLGQTDRKGHGRPNAERRAQRGHRRVARIEAGERRA